MQRLSLRLLPLLFTAVLALGLVGCDSGGTDDGDGQVATTVQFTQPAVNVTEADSTATLGVSISNPPADERVTVEVLFAEDASAPVTRDSLEGYQTQTVVFPAGVEDGAVRELTVDFDVNLEPGQGLQAYFALQQASGPARIAEPRELTLRIGRNVLPIAEARARSIDEIVTVEGLVTRITEDNVFIQDETGGIVVFAPGTDAEGEFADAVTNGDVSVGDRVQVTGAIDEFGGLREVVDVGTEFAVLSSGNDLPEPTTLTIEELLADAEQYEGTRVRVEGLTTDASGTFVGGGSEGNYTVSDGTGSITLRIPGDSFYDGQPIPTGEFTFVGVLGEFFSGYQLFAIEEGDLIYDAEGGGNTPPTAAFSFDPSDPTAGAAVSFDASASGDADGSIASYAWAFGDGESGSGQTTTHTYDAAGDYDVTLTVTDDAGATATTTQTVSVGAGATATLLSEGFQNQEDLAPFMTYSVASDSANWVRDSFDGEAYAYINGFGADEASNDWLISPAFNFDSYTEETLSFMNTKRFEGPDINVLVSTDYSGSGNPENATWTDITDRANLDSDTGGYTFVSSSEIDVSDFNGQQVYIALQYVTDGTESGQAATWEIDEIEVTGNEQ